MNWAPLWDFIETLPLAERANLRLVGKKEYQMDVVVHWVWGTYTYSTHVRMFFLKKKWIPGWNHGNAACSRWMHIVVNHMLMLSMVKPLIIFGDALGRINIGMGGGRRVYPEHLVYVCTCVWEKGLLGRKVNYMSKVSINLMILILLVQWKEKWSLSLRSLYI